MQACNFIKKETLAQVFYCEFCETLKITFFKEHLGTTFSNKKIKFSVKDFCNECEQSAENCGFDGKFHFCAVFLMVYEKSTECYRTVLYSNLFYSAFS